MNGADPLLDGLKLKDPGLGHKDVVWFKVTKKFLLGNACTNINDSWYARRHDLGISAVSCVLSMQCDSK